MTDQIWRSGRGSSVASFETKLYGTITIDIFAFGKNPSIAGISGDDYDPSPIGSTYHEYRSVFRTGVLANEKSLSEMQHLLKEQPTPVTKTFAGPGYVFDGNPAGVNYVVNVTECFQHLLNPGIVKREVIVDRAEYVIVTTGIGTGAFPSINVNPTIGGIVWGIAGLLGFGSHQLAREYNPYPVIVGVVPNGFGASVNVIYTGYTGRNTGYDSPSEGQSMRPGTNPAPRTIADARAQERDYTNSQKTHDENYYNAPVGGPNSGSSDGEYNGSKSSATPAPHTIADARAQEQDYANSQGNKRPTADPKDISRSVLDDIHSKSGKIWSEKSGSGAGGRDEGSKPGPGQTLSKDTTSKETKSKETKSKETKSDNDPGKKGPRPVVLDLDGNGFDISTLGTSSTFVAMDETGLLTRTAWARGNDGVLVIDADGDGKISSSKEFVFTEWAPSRTMRIRYRFNKNARSRTDCEALKRCSGF